MESLLLYRHHSIHSYCYSQKYRTFVPSIINTIEDMKKIYLLIAIVGMSISGYGQTHNWEWGRCANSYSVGLGEGWNIATDQ